MRKALVLNDTRRDPTHTGCSEVMRNLFHLAKQQQINVVASISTTGESLKSIVTNYLPKIDLIIINGEGTFHDDKPTATNIIEAAQLAKKDKKEIWLINTIWENNSTLNAYLPTFDKIAARDKRSLFEIQKKYPTAIYAPDLSLWGPKNTFHTAQFSDNNIIFTDSVDPKITQTLFRASKKSHSFFRMSNSISFKKSIRDPTLLFDYIQTKNLPYLSIEDIKKSSGVVTGRFHAMILCIKHGIPFIAVESNTQKILATLEDIGFSNLDMYVSKDQLSKEKLKEYTRAIHDIWGYPELNAMRNYAQSSNSKIEAIFKSG